VLEIDSSKGRTDVWSFVKNCLVTYTSIECMNEKLLERSECLLGLRIWPKKVKIEDKLKCIFVLGRLSWLSRKRNAMRQDYSTIPKL